MNEAAQRALPNTAQTDLDGQSREFRSSGGEIYFTFVLALMFIYLVLSAQFESFVHPFVIMLSVPLSMTGALFTLWLAGGTLNIYSQVGLVTLVGLITKHGILIVEFSNQLRAKGEPLLEAVIDSATLRLRPILMTTGAMVLGRGAARARDRRRRGIANADRLGDRRRHGVRHAAHAVRRADRLHAARRPPREAAARRGARGIAAASRIRATAPTDGVATLRPRRARRWRRRSSAGSPGRNVAAARPSTASNAACSRAMMRVPFTRAVRERVGAERLDQVDLGREARFGRRARLEVLGAHAQQHVAAVSFAGIRFIGGEPMKPATNVVAGFA